jgi:hypothetical protein
MVWLAIYLVGWAVPDGANVSQDILVTIQCVEGEVAAELERRDTWLSAYSPTVSLRSAWNNYPDDQTVKGNIEGNV